MLDTLGAVLLVQTAAKRGEYVISQQVSAKNCKLFQIITVMVVPASNKLQYRAFVVVPNARKVSLTL